MGVERPANEPPSLRLPVVLAFAVEGYELFPGADGGGIRQEFPRGVTIIAGVNGLGKTTFLNAIYRTLTGPFDSEIAVRIAMGAQKPVLRRWSASEYFGRRVEDHAELATVALTVAFGDDRIEIRRSLADLALRALIVNGQPADAAAYREAFEQIASDDSARRNIRVQVNKLRGQVDRARQTVDVDRQVRTRLRELEPELDLARAATSSLTDRVATLDDRRRDERERLLRTHMRLCHSCRGTPSSSKRSYARCSRPRN